MKRQESIEVYNSQHARFRQTKEIQWKFNLATWALIALGINFSEKLKDRFDYSNLLTMVILFFIAHMIFAIRTQRALEADKIVSKHILRQLNWNTDDNFNVEVDIDKLTKKIKIGWTGWWWIFFQALSTGILLALFFMTIDCK